MLFDEGIIDILYIFTSLYNVGVLVVNNRELKKLSKLHQRLVMVSSKDLDNGDQTVANDIYKGHFAPLHPKYNYRVGAEVIVNNNSKVIDKLNQIHSAKIIHYMTSSHGPSRRLSDIVINGGIIGGLTGLILYVIV